MLLSFAEEIDSSPRTARGTVRQRKAVLAAPGDHGKFVCVCVCVSTRVCVFVHVRV